MKVSITWEYKASNGKAYTTFTSQWMAGTEAIQLAKDIEKTGRVQSLAFHDEEGESWTKKELEKLLKEVETEPHNLIVYFDGGYHKEYRVAGLGVVIYFEQNNKPYRIRKNEVVEAIDSNNDAEYAAFWLALRELETLGAHHLPVTFRGDSQVVLNQLGGEWPVFEERENRWIDRIEAKLAELGLKPHYESIGRAENKEADMLATQALKGEIIFSRKQL
ncbi:reverse transcriptase-like protein [Aneurinibacillus aneurinilyticus]|uniref:Reverse transcriptase-like protein n=1 Tax=Aneurinibacillus aneurinilyticus TaxID=1391 RepID=A0A848CQ51_ANEAE|nr:reverse transcriptase-like protein [Aneurinibacillus aneurinilyticus]MED0668735.1 reverse transcriptase-like protein [Aneurinibacillus aneurinilyticus]NME97318.1 reverse transcriptase-like protein [Aneurinibacillus aneurinilyticus]